MTENTRWTANFDALYRESDRLYYTIARTRSLSECAFWVLYSIEESGGCITQRELAERYSYSKQTVNSAVKSLVAKGLVELVLAEGSRKSKNLRLTEAGQAFSRENIVPAMQAEQRAFETLSPEERGELLRLVRKYTGAIVAQIKQAKGGEDA